MSQHDVDSTAFVQDVPNPSFGAVGETIIPPASPSGVSYADSLDGEALLGDQTSSNEHPADSSPPGLPVLITNNGLASGDDVPSDPSVAVADTDLLADSALSRDGDATSSGNGSADDADLSGLGVPLRDTRTVVSVGVQTRAVLRKRGMLSLCVWLDV